MTTGRASLEPALVSFSVVNTSKTWPDLRRATHLGVTILADQHGEVCRRLAGPWSPATTRSPCSSCTPWSR